MKARTEVVRKWRTDYLNNVKKIVKSINRMAESGRAEQRKDVGFQVLSLGD